ncbi:RICIN domain-containing protein [Kitasatospora mediocidica]|uniref:RICIN domain-containing protein n=1 Tax=Kitasatospora mediocidica TaxID=58352 RepID=UPI000567CE2E|nr:RICIN domain-containing protein [Kitasatospora mediocidica]
MRTSSRRTNTAIRRVVAGTLLSALAATGLMAVPQQASAATDCPGQEPGIGGAANIGNGNCYSALISSIGNMIGGFRSAALTAQADNAAFTQGMAGQLSAAAPGFNVMVFKYDGTDLYDTIWFRNVYEADMNGVLVDTTVKLEHHDSEGGPAGYDDFRIWVFAGDSTFTNKGDGGYGNWAFVGNDSDRTVSTTRSCVLIRCTDSQRIIHFPARDITTPAVSSGDAPPTGTPVTPATPATPGTVPGVSTGGTATPGVPATPGTVPGVSTGGTATPGVPAHQGGGSGGGTIAGLLYPKVKTGQGPVASGSTSGPSVLAGNSGAKNSGWQFTSAGNGRYKITSAVSGLALTENTKTYDADAKPWTGADEQKWQLVSQGDGQYQIRITDQDCLTYDEDAKALGVWTCTNAWNQQWKLQ